MSIQSQLTALATAVGNLLRDTVYPRLVPPGGVTGQLVARAASGYGWVNAPTGGGGTTIVDNRKFAPLLARGLAGAKVVWSGDSTTEQMDWNYLTPHDGTAGVMAEWFPRLAGLKHYNHGRNGAMFIEFIKTGLDSGGNVAGTPTSLDDICLKQADVYMMSWGINDMRGHLDPGGLIEAGKPERRPDWRGAYGSAGQIAAALMVQDWMKEVVRRLRLANPNCVIVWRCPNPAQTGTSYMENGVTAQQMTDVLHLAYLGNAALGVPSAESFGPNILVFDTQNTVFGRTAYTAANNLVSDGLHPTFMGYANCLWLMGLLMDGPTPSEIATQREADELMWREQALTKGWGAPDDVLMNSKEWMFTFTTKYQSGASNYVDYEFGPLSTSQAYAGGQTGQGQTGRSFDMALAFDDQVIWTKADASKLRYAVKALPIYASSALRWQSGQDMNGGPLPATIPDTAKGRIYQSRLGFSTIALMNEWRQKSLDPSIRRESFKKAIPFTVFDAQNGSMTIRGIGGRAAADGDTIYRHAWSTSDMIGLAGVEGDNSGLLTFAGLPLTGATFSFYVDDSEVTITKAGVDFRTAIGRQGVLLTNSTVSPPAAETQWVNEPATARTLTLADIGKGISMTASAANVITVPAFADVAIPANTHIPIEMAGTGVTSVVGASGVTVSVDARFIKSLAGRYSSAVLVCRGSNNWRLVGALAVAP